VSREIAWDNGRLNSQADNPRGAASGAQKGAQRHIQKRQGAIRTGAIAVKGGPANLPFAERRESQLI